MTKHIKKSFLINLLMVAICLLSGQPGWADNIRMGYFELRPHMYKSKTTGRPAGAAITFFEKIARTMGCDVTWVGPLPHARLVSYLKKGELIDGDPIMSFTADREKYLYFPETPFYLAKPNFLVRKDHPLIKIDSAEDVKGFVVGQFSQAANSKFVMDNYSFFKFDVIAGGEILN